MEKRVLLIAFHFPPASGSSGVHRAHTLAKYLPELGWHPIVLTAHPRAYPTAAARSEEESFPASSIFRAQALDSARHLSFRGAYFDFLAWPDRWISWYPTAVLRARQLIRTYRPHILWCTYPIATAMLIGLTVHRLSGLPWVADFRDSMTDTGFPVGNVKRRIHHWIEKKTVAAAESIVFTAPGTKEMYAARFPWVTKGKWQTILNGFDEDAFLRAESLRQSTARSEAHKKLILLHSGVIYPKERDPTSLFQAISQLKVQGVLTESSFELRLRATGHDEQLSPIAEKLNISDLVSFLPPLPYERALSEMLDVDGLLLLQASSCNHQIPAKVYEYARAKRPILALTDENSDTAWLLNQLGNHILAPLNSAPRIAETLPNFLDCLRSGWPSEKRNSIDAFSRFAQAKKTAELFDQVLHSL